MGQYNGIQGFRTLSVCALLAALAAGCAQQPAQPVQASYPLTVPASQPEVAAQDEPISPMVPAPRAAAPRLRSEAPLRYVVKKGDTLWGIANRFLLDAWQWPEIWYVNDQVRNPHRIYPGDVLTLVYVDGSPRLINGEMNTDLGVYDGEVVKLEPGVREGTLRSAIPAIPIEALRDFLNSSRVVTPEQMQNAAYVVAFLDPQIVAGAGAQAYVMNHQPGEETSYALVRSGETYRDPETGKLLGYEAIPVGTIEITDTRQSPVTAKLVRTVREARPGDRLLPLEKDRYDAFFYPKAPLNKVNGRIISVLDGVSQITQFQVVTLNRGTRHGLERGDVLTVLQTGRTARDPTTSSDREVRLPDLDAGTAMVFKVLPEISYALVMNSTRAIHRLDRVESPIHLP